MTEWRAIETAPKDGTNILLGYFPDHGGESQEVAFWHSIHQKWCGRVLLNADGIFSPSHWAPLLPPPPIKCNRCGLLVLHGVSLPATHVLGDCGGTFVRASYQERAE